MPAIKQRYDFVYLFDVADGNPNGDPDAGNLPRVDPETNQGLVTDVCLKRKVRNYVSMVRDGAEGYGIYMAERAVLNLQHERAWKALDIPPDEKTKYARLPKDEAKSRELTAWMCANFYDIRAFGAVMTTQVNAGQVRGPVQLAFARSVEPVTPIEVSITRGSVTNVEDAAKKDREMGRKHILPYGLYCAHGVISGRLANDQRKGTGFSEEDLDLFWQALENMFEHDRSAARGEMAARKLIVFEHDSDLGNSPAHKLFDCVEVKRIFDAEEFDLPQRRGSNLPPARRFADYRVILHEERVPKGVRMQVRF
jgi:CRISPR-associated protein Csd2